MKKYSYHIVIAALVTVLGLSMYTLYGKKEIENISNTQELQDNKSVDILELKRQKRNNLNTLRLQNIDTNKITKNLNDLKDELSKTKDMLKQYNLNNANVLIKDSDIDKLVSLDLEHSPKIENVQNDEFTKKEEQKEEEEEEKIKEKEEEDKCVDCVIIIPSKPCVGEGCDDDIDPDDPKPKKPEEPKLPFDPCDSDELKEECKEIEDTRNTSDALK